VKRGWLHRRFRGVFAVGHTVSTRKARWMEAALAQGPRGVLSHKDAITAHDLRPPRGGPVDVTVPGRGRRSQPGIRVHSVRQLDPRDVTKIDGIPVTTVSRSLLDYAEQATFQDLRHALDAAARQQKLNLLDINATIARNPGRRGIKTLRRALALMGDHPPWTQSENERMLLGGCREAGLPEPSLNVMIEDLCVDCAWIRYRLVVEVDSDTYHSIPADVASDSERDEKLEHAGWIVLRIREDRLKHDLPGVIEEIRTRLIRQGWRAAA
jgi:very-short-patch-repair endonuclease